MKKIVLTFIMMGLCGLSVMAQNQQTNDTKTAQESQQADREREFKGFNISVQGGALFSMNENTWTYEKKSELISGQGAVSVGYDFGHKFGARLQGAFSGNASAGNQKETSAHGFYPYTFKAVTVFADAVLNLNGLFDAEKQHLFETKIYAGIGAGFSSIGDDSIIKNHPNYPLDFSKPAFGFRGGIIEEMYINKNFGAFIDLNLEAYTDNFNGMNPVETKADDNFPLDGRFTGSIGIAYHF